VYGINSQPLAV